MATGNNTQRKRGVRASRAKLAHALTEAGLKTQAALAERIADLEGLDAAPKDIVNRVFRELPVEITTLERVARALGVDAYTLYKSSDEENSPTDQNSASGGADGSTSWLIVAAGLLVVVLAGVILGSMWLGSGNTGLQRIRTDAQQQATEPLSLGAATLAVMPIVGDDSGDLSQMLRSALSESFSVATGTASTLIQNLDAKAAAEKLRTDAVLDGDIVTVGRLSALRIYLFARGVRQQIWADSWPSAAFEAMHGDIGENVALAVRRAAGLPTPDGARQHFPLAPVQDDYLEGEYHLDRPSNELNIKRAQSRFEAALRQDANYARAHAGLCQTLLEEHWMSDEERALKDAATTCGQALQLDPDDPVVATAHAHYLRRTGRNNEAMALYNDVIDEHPRDSSALSGLANSLLAAYRQTGEADYLQQAKKNARIATDVDTVSWKPAFALATMEWFDSNVDGAIAAAEIARRRDENEYVLANLGNFYVCAGDFDNALEAYQQAKNRNPDSYVGDEFLGQAYYFLGNFKKSAELRQRAIDSIAGGEPEIHEMWGNLGDAYRQIDDREKAIHAYMKAAEIAERDHLRGTAAIADRAARAYYYTALHTLDTSRVPQSVMNSIDDEIDEIAAAISSATAHRRMAQTYLLRNQAEPAKRSLAAASAKCSGYRDMPDFDSI